MECNEFLARTDFGIVVFVVVVNDSPFELGVATAKVRNAHVDVVAVLTELCIGTRRLRRNRPCAFRRTFGQSVRFHGVIIYTDIVVFARITIHLFVINSNLVVNCATGTREIPVERGCTVRKVLNCNGSIA